MIRNYRNLIHPGKEIRTNEEFDHDTAIVSFSLVKIVIKELRINYISKYGYKAEEILNKILSDDSTESIFDMLLKKIGKFEIHRLFDLIVDYWINERENKENRQTLKLKRYFTKLKSTVDNEKIIEKLKILIEQVERGSEGMVISLFELLGTELDKISIDDKKLILTYIYEAGGQTEWWSAGLLKFHNRYVYDYLGLYRTPNDIKMKFANLCIKIIDNFNVKHKHKYFTSYEKLMSNFEPDLIISSEKYLSSQFNNDKPKIFYEAYKSSNDDLPF